jgi:hypothetical protein
MGIENAEGEVLPDESLGATLSDPPRYAKAIMAAALAGVGTAAVAAVDGFTSPEGWGIIATTVTAFVGVYGVRNK